MTALSRRLAAHLRAGALAGGGSFVALAGAVVLIDMFGPESSWLTAWIGVSVLLAGLAARSGHPAPPAGALAFAGRVFSALFIGAALIAIVVIPVASRTNDRIDAAGIFTIAGAALLTAAAITGRRRAIVALPNEPEFTGALPAVSREELAESYVLVANGPPVTAAESERSALVVEVRIAWGAELLRVEHLDPPRAYFAGEISSDLAMGQQMLGAEHAALVRCDAGAEPRVVVPPGAKAVVERAGDEAKGPRREDADAGATIDLALGVRVILTFAASAGSAYRAPAGHAPLIVESALVRAGRVVGREPSLARAQRPLAAWAITGAIVAAALAWSARGAPPSPDEDEVSSERAAEIARVLRIIDGDKRPDEDEPPLPRHYVRVWRENTSFYDTEWMFPEGPHGPTSLDAFPDFATGYCRQFDDPSPWSTPPAWRNAGREFCASRVVTPFGVRGEWPRTPDLLGWDPRDLWMLRYPGGPVARHGTVVMNIPVVKGPLSPAIVDRIVLANTANVRRCYREQLLADPVLSGNVKVRFVIGVDGAVTNLANGGSDIPNPLVVSCAVRSFYALSFPHAEKITTVIQPIAFWR